MKRDMDLVRQILLEIEKAPYAGSLGIQPIALEGYSEDEIYYHITLLVEAGLIEPSGAQFYRELCPVPSRLTWAGHEFLDAARSDRVWNQVKEAGAKVGGLAFDVLKPLLIQVALSLARDHLGLP